MSEQSNSHAQILKEADAYLSKNDVTNYWLTIEKISPLYGRVATDVATGGPHGLGARERLQDAAEDQLGRRFTEAELDGIESAIAKADRNMRQSNLDKHGVAGVSLKDTDNYHQKVFKDNRLRADTYTLHGLVNAMDDEAKTRLDTASNFTSDTLNSLADQPRKSISAGMQYGIDTLEAIGRRITNADSQDDETGPPETGAPVSDDHGKPNSEKPSDTGGAAKPRSFLPSTEPKLDIDNPSPDVARITTAFMPRSDLSATRDDMLLKPPHVLTADEVRDLHFAYWDTPGADPIRDDINDHLTAFYERTYGTDPVPVDDTGKTVDPGPKRAIPKQPSPVTTPDGGALADGLKRVAGTLATAAQADGVVPVVKALQTGLNTFGQRLKVDGDPGPKTQAAVRQVAVKQGPGKIEEATALGGFNAFARANKGISVAANDLDRTVRTKVEPLFSAPAKTPSDTDDQQPTTAGRALQQGLNDLAVNDAKPLKEDGVLGPKTAAAFQSALATHDPDDVTASFATSLGFS